MQPPLFDFTPGRSPVLVTIPHGGTMLPPELEPRLTAAGRLRPDTDWYLDQVHDAVTQAGHGLLKANWSRYVIDLNRGADDASLYPGRATTGLVPLVAFDGTALYPPGQEPDGAEIQSRIARFWQPYHDAVARELDRLRAQWGWAVLWDAHSIRSQVPRLFDGTLPDLNFGTNEGATCHPSLIGAITAEAASSPYSQVLDGRFKGGFTTRHYGRPDQDIHAVQLEMSQVTYLASEDAPFPADPGRLDRLRRCVTGLIDVAGAWRPPGQAV